ncbi:MAG: hypothetical protein AB7G93_23425 [Bdellovibrionales bacterium]
MKRRAPRLELRGETAFIERVRAYRDIGAFGFYDVERILGDSRDGIFHVGGGGVKGGFTDEFTAMKTALAKRQSSRARL